MKEGLVEPHARAIADRATHDPSQHVGAAVSVGEHPVGDEKRGGSGVICDDLEGRLTVSLGAGDASQRLGEVHEGAEQLRLVVGLHAGDRGGETLEPSPRVDAGLGQRDELSVRHLLVLHEHEVPELKIPIVLEGRALAGLPRVRRRVTIDADVDLTTGPTRTGVAHLPEVLLRVEGEDAIRRNELAPELVRLLIERGAFSRPVEDRYAQTARRDAEHLRQKVPAEADGVLLEVVPEGEIYEHLKQRVVTRGEADVVEVVMLTAGAEAPLLVALL